MFRPYWVIRQSLHEYVTRYWIVYLLHAGFLAALFFDYEDGCNMLVRNVGWISKDYMTLYPTKENSF
jgi:hypothetical protein